MAPVPSNATGRSRWFAWPDVSSIDTSSAGRNHRQQKTPDEPGLCVLLSTFSDVDMVAHQHSHTNVKHLICKGFKFAICESYSQPYSLYRPQNEKQRIACWKNHMPPLLFHAWGTDAGVVASAAVSCLAKRLAKTLNQLNGLRSLIRFPTVDLTVDSKPSVRALASSRTPYDHSTAERLGRQPLHYHERQRCDT